MVEIEPGERLLIGLEAIGDADERGMRTVMCTINGQLRPIQVRDRSVAVGVAGRREGRPARARPRRRAVRRRGDARRSAEGDEVEAGDDRGHDRGDEDGGGHHHAGRRARSQRVALDGSSRSRAATWCWWSDQSQECLIANQDDRRPNISRKSSPDTETLDCLPTRTIATTRPPQSPWPVRCLIRIPMSRPIPEYADSILEA